MSESSDDSFIQFDKKSPILCSKIRESFENICFDDGADEDVDWDDEEHGDGGLVQLEDFENVSISEQLLLGINRNLSVLSAGGEGRG